MKNLGWTHHKFLWDKDRSQQLSSSWPQFMKTLLTVCLSLIALTAFAQTRPAAPPPNAPATAASPAAPANAAPPVGNPAAPAVPGAPPPAAGMSPAPANGMSPAGPAGVPPAPGTSVTATLSGSLSPSPGTSPAPGAGAAAAPTTAVSGNFLIDNFRKGGPIMWPILIVSIIGVTVVLERIFWWLGRWFRRGPKRIEKVFTAIEVGDVAEASRL